MVKTVLLSIFSLHMFFLELFYEDIFQKNFRWLTLMDFNQNDIGVPSIKYTQMERILELYYLDVIYKGYG